MRPDTKFYFMNVMYTQESTACDQLIGKLFEACWTFCQVKLYLCHSKNKKHNYHKMICLLTRYPQGGHAKKKTIRSGYALLCKDTSSKSGSFVNIACERPIHDDLLLPLQDLFIYCKTYQTIDIRNKFPRN